MIRMYKHARSYDTLSYSFVHLTLNSEFKMIAMLFNILVTRTKIYMPSERFVEGG